MNLASIVAIALALAIAWISVSLPGWSGASVAFDPPARHALTLA